MTENDAQTLFEQLKPVSGKLLPDGANEIHRLARQRERTIMNKSTSESNALDHDAARDDELDAYIPFSEGVKSWRLHRVVERNSCIRKAFFNARPSGLCEFCGLDTAAAYPWVKRILDMHHLLPLSSGARTSTAGTRLEDLVAICPTCHRGVHRYYSRWLKKHGRKDFANAEQAK